MSTPIFPALKGLKYPVIRHPLTKTQGEETYTGFTAAYPAWSFPRYRFELSFSVLRSQNDWQTLEGFIRQVQFSPGGIFQYRFGDDGAVTDQIFAVGTGSPTRFQLVRTHGGFTEPVLAISTITNVKADGVLVSAANYSVDERGRLTFTAAPTSGALLTWTGSFNWYCRFDDDDAQLSNFAYGYWEMGKIAFTTVKTP